MAALFCYLCRHSCIYLCRVPVVKSRREFSPQTLSVLAALFQEPSRWHHGYALASQTGMKSGTLYPILIRLADRGLVEACWQEEPQPGRPRRHLYRVATDQLAAGTAALAAAPQPTARPAARTSRTGRRMTARLAP
jgi:PadR family transcriptional regulator PadR